jgi:DegV family protein with EDD domain
MQRADEGDGVVVLTVSSKMSASYQSAVVAAGTYDGDVQVIDSGTAAGAEGLIALAAVEAARTGASLEAVAKRASTVADKVRLVAEVGDLRPLARSGRLPASIASMGNVLGLRPVFEFRRGSVKVLRPQLTLSGARNALLSTWRSSAEAGARLHVTAMHASGESAARKLLDIVTDESPAVTAFVGRFGPVMVAHTGPQVVGLAWWWEAGE